MSAATTLPGSAQGAGALRGRRALLGAALPVALLLLWQVLGTLSADPRMPLPSKIVAAAVTMIADGELPMAIVQSLGRVFAGFVVAALLAIPLGLAMGYSRAVERNVDPLVETFRPIAAIAVLPLAILWLGTGTSAAIAIVAYAAFFPLVVNTVAGARNVPPTLLRAAATMGLRKFTTVRTVVVPAALPQIGVGLRIAMGVGWTAIVAAELAVGAKAGGGGSGGIGQMMFVFYAYSIELNRIIVCMLAVGLVALLLDRILRWALARLMPWSAR
ncbi:MAG: ABC transporter permease [Proteobacteria bacterium]|nr:ABC transporter permease [Pseudomonadota bacterium]